MYMPIVPPLRQVLISWRLSQLAATGEVGGRKLYIFAPLPLHNCILAQGCPSAKAALVLPKAVYQSRQPWLPE